MSDAIENPRRLSPARKAWLFLRLLARPTLARKLGTLVTEGYLARTGWVRSVLSGEIVDEDGKPLPWMPRPFVDFLAPRLNPRLRVFEYGAGASTLFFGERVGQVVSVEHDAAFAAALAPRLPANVRVLVRARDSAGYVQAIAEMEKAPHLVVVDGFQRIECAAAARPLLAPDGVLVLDDSERAEYGPVDAGMRQAGFRSLEFWGLAPCRIEHRCTTLFYRTDNVLGI